MGNRVSRATARREPRPPGPPPGRRTRRSWLMHLRLYAADALAVVVEVDVGVVGQQGHRHGAVGDALGDHQGGEALAEGVVVVAGLPDGDTLRLSRLDRADRRGILRHR